MAVELNPTDHFAFEQPGAFRVAVAYGDEEARAPAVIAVEVKSRPRRGVTAG